MVGPSARAKAGLLAGAVAALAALASWALAPYRHRPMLRELPAFVLCETDWGKPCQRWQPTRWLSDFHEPLSLRARDIFHSGRRPVVLHVGAHNFHDDVIEYHPLLAALFRQTAAPRLVLVEPDQDMREILQNTHTKLGLKAEDVTVLSVAMKKECDGDDIQYVFGDQLFADFAPNEGTRIALRLSMRSWRTYDKSRLGKIVTIFATDKQFSTGEGSSRQFDHFHSVIVPLVKKIYAAGNWTQYIEEERVPCMSAADLVKALGILPDDILMLTVDVEGLEIPIMESFTEIRAFRPTLVRWEGSLADARAKRLLGFFRERSYFLGQTGQSHSQDVVGYLGPAV